MFQVHNVEESGPVAFLYRGYPDWVTTVVYKQHKF
jgi:hypothetical protein